MSTNHRGEVNPVSGCRRFTANPDKEQAGTTSEEDETLQARVRQRCNLLIPSPVLWNGGTLEADKGRTSPTGNTC